MYEYIGLTRSTRTSSLLTESCVQPIGGIESFSFAPITGEPGPTDQRIALVYRGAYKWICRRRGRCYLQTSGAEVRRPSV